MRAAKEHTAFDSTLTQQKQSLMMQVQTDI